MNPILGEYDPEEIDIAKNLAKYKSDDLFKYDFAKVDRILSIYFQLKNRDSTDEKRVVSFLFDCLDEYEKRGSMLFRHLQDSPERNNVIIKLHDEYKDKFDFNYINGSLFNFSYDMMKENQKLKYYKYLFFALLASLLLSLAFHIPKNTNNANKVHHIDKTVKQTTNFTNLLEIMKKELYDEMNNINNTLTNKIKEQNEKTKNDMKNEFLSIREQIILDILNQTKSQINSFAEDTKNEIIKQIKDELSTFLDQWFDEVKNQTKDEMIIIKEQVKTEAINQLKEELRSTRKRWISNVLNQTKTEIDNIQKQAENETIKKINNELLLIRDKTTNDAQNQITMIKEQAKNEINYIKQQIEKEIQPKTQEKENTVLLVFKIIFCISDLIFEIIIWLGLDYKDVQMNVILMICFSIIQSILIWFNGNVLFIINTFIFLVVLDVIELVLPSFQKYNLIFYIYYLSIITSIKYYIAIPKKFSSGYYAFCTIVFIIDNIINYNSLNNLEVLKKYISGIMAFLFTSIVDVKNGFIAATINSMIGLCVSIFSVYKEPSLPIIFLVIFTSIIQLYYFINGLSNIDFLAVITGLVIFEFILCCLNIDFQEHHRIFIEIILLYFRCARKRYSENVIIAVNSIFGIGLILFSFKESNCRGEIASKVFLILSIILFSQFYFDWIKL